MIKIEIDYVYHSSLLESYMKSNITCKVTINFGDYKFLLEDKVKYNSALKIAKHICKRLRIPIYDFVDKKIHKLEYPFDGQSSKIKTKELK